MVAIQNELRAEKRPGWVTPAVIGLLLALRLVLLGLVTSWLGAATPDWLEPFFEISTYLLTLFLIWWERDHLVEYHIGWLVVGIILACKPLETLLSIAMHVDNGLNFPQLGALIIWAAAGMGLAALLISKPAIRPASRADWRLLLLGMLAGALLAILDAYPLALQLKFEGGGVRPRLLSEILGSFPITFLYQLGYAAVSEEPLFRGFLWGYLRRTGWRSVWIWLFQAGLFTLGHIFYIKMQPYSFWLLVPTSALVLGALAWKSRSIVTSMAAHATVNTLAFQLGTVVFNWLY